MKRMISIAFALCLFLCIPTATFAINYKCPNDDSCSAHLFKDVDEDSWYHLYVDYVEVHHKAIKPISQTEFGINTPVSRGECIYAIHRMDDGFLAWSAWDEKYIDWEFSDIDFDSEIYDACVWGQKHGIITGYEDGSFRPDELITREQMAAIVYRYCLEKEGPGADKIVSIRKFIDHEEVSEWANRAMGFMVWKEYYRGNERNELSPLKNITRAEFCTILYRIFDPWEGGHVGIPDLPGLSI